MSSLLKIVVDSENYLEEVQHHLNVAAVQSTVMDARPSKKFATRLKNFFECPIEELETEATKRVGLTFCDRVVFCYTDKTKAETSQLKRWNEFMLVDKDGNHYELNEIKDNSASNEFPLLSSEEIAERSIEARILFDVDSE